MSLERALELQKELDEIKKTLSPSELAMLGVDKPEDELLRNMSFTARCVEIPEEPKSHPMMYDKIGLHESGRKTDDIDEDFNSGIVNTVKINKGSIDREIGQTIKETEETQIGRGGFIEDDYSSMFDQYYNRNLEEELRLKEEYKIKTSVSLDAFKIKDYRDEEFNIEEEDKRINGRVTLSKFVGYISEHHNKYVEFLEQCRTVKRSYQEFLNENPRLRNYNEAKKSLKDNLKNYTYNNCPSTFEELYNDYEALIRNKLQIKNIINDVNKLNINPFLVFNLAYYDNALVEEVKARVEFINDCFIEVTGIDVANMIISDNGITYKDILQSYLDYKKNYNRNYKINMRVPYKYMIKISNIHGTRFDSFINDLKNNGIIYGDTYNLTGEEITKLELFFSNIDTKIERAYNHDSFNVKGLNKNLKQTLIAMWLYKKLEKKHNY